MLMNVQNLKPQVYDPRGVVRSVAIPTAKRIGTLSGLRLGVLDNSKWNANKLLRGAIEVLGKEIDFNEIHYYVKHSFSKDAAPELIEKIVEENDIVLTAIGDCGSCTSGCLRDAIALEQRDVPTAVIVTTEFVKETVLTRQALGMTELEPVIISHPVSSITMEEIAQRVAQIFTQAQAVWMGEQSGAADAYLQTRSTPD
ncbi:hypothetical protein CAP48_04130 [Advenella sp. S44]|uniref:UGSC family (seleno)protein n=1 Tax=Advenella sp. S44 TaxID=1982755 RepID=UPI000C29F002|nr:UGSC family (seleno)protein [Advenella sp. S44]PJX25260.1 hypothetical protein CAP48_04130 [Advenella sp. S44]